MKADQEVIALRAEIVKAHRVYADARIESAMARVEVAALKSELARIENEKEHAAHKDDHFAQQAARLDLEIRKSKEDEKALSSTLESVHFGLGRILSGGIGRTTVDLMGEIKRIRGLIRPDEEAT